MWIDKFGNHSMVGHDPLSTLSIATLKKPFARLSGYIPQSEQLRLQYVICIFKHQASLQNLDKGMFK